MTPSRFHLTHPGGPVPGTADLAALAEEAWAFHRALPGYAPTPLVPRPDLAAELGIGGLWVKDESPRFGLQAFKGLGASFAVHRLLQGAARPAGLATATDGNHGRAVAWAARRAGLPARVFVPAHTVAARVANIEREGAAVEVVDGDYDAAVQAADRFARAHGWALVQDTAYAGYEEIPRWITAGYTTHFRELEVQSAAAPLHAPGRPAVDLVLLQAGVGSWAACGTTYYHHRYGAARPRLAVVEPLDAACVLAAVAAGRLERAPGSAHTIMAGLDCATASGAAWPVLAAGTDACVAIADAWAEEAVRRLAAPADGAGRVVAGETGASGLAGLMALARDPALAPVRARLGLGPASRVLVFVTEGATDPAGWRRITGHLPPE